MGEVHVPGLMQVGPRALLPASRGPASLTICSGYQEDVCPLLLDPALSEQPTVLATCPRGPAIRGGPDSSALPLAAVRREALIRVVTRLESSRGGDLAYPRTSLAVESFTGSPPTEARMDAGLASRE